MLDSDILIELKRNKPEAWQWFNSLIVPPPVCGFAALGIAHRLSESDGTPCRTYLS